MEPPSNSIRRKKPWLALGVSLMRPGLGQLYNEQPRKAMVFLALPYVLIWLWFCISLVNSMGLKVPGLVFLTVLFVSAWIWNLADAFLSARGKMVRVPAPLYSRWQVYIAVFVVEAILSSVLYPKKYIRAHYFEPYVMPANSMAPTLIEGDRFYVDKRRFRYGILPIRGELVVFRSVDLKTVYVKRAVGLPGDKIELRNGVLFVNETEASQTLYNDRRGMENIDLIERKRVYTESLLGKEHLFMLDRNFDGQAVRSFGPVTVPESHFFALGDYRDNSYDSRQFGSVPLNNLLGKPIQIWFSYDFRLKISNWRRIGMDLQ